MRRTWLWALAGAVACAAAATRIEDQVAPQAEWLVGRLKQLHYAVDYSPASLWEADRFINEAFPGGEPMERIQPDVGRIIFALGAYSGEVVRRSKGGAWRWDGKPDDPDAEVDIELRLPAGPRQKPMRRALGRIREGFRESMAVWAREQGVDPGAAPDWTRTAWSRPQPAPSPKR